MATDKKQAIRNRKSYSSWYTLVSWLITMKPTPRAIAEATYNTLNKAGCFGSQTQAIKERESLGLALEDLKAN